MPSAPSFIYRRNKKRRAFAQNFSELACDVIAGVSAWVLLVAVSAAIATATLIRTSVCRAGRGCHLSISLLSGCDLDTVNSCSLLPCVDFDDLIKGVTGWALK